MRQALSAGSIAFASESVQVTRRQTRVARCADFSRQWDTSGVLSPPAAAHEVFLSPDEPKIDAEG